MVGISEAFAQLYSPGLVRVKKAAPEGVRSWLTHGVYRPVVSDNQLVLTGTDWENYLSCVAHDVNRLAMAGHETICSISEVQGLPKSTPWSLIKAYYAAFYYSQVIMRLCRQWPTYFSTLELRPLEKICIIYGVHPPSPLTTGQFFIQSNDLEKQLSISKPNNGTATHETMWSEMNKLIDRASQIVEASTYGENERKQIQAELKNMKTALNASTFSKPWLSSLRNDVQYAQKMGVWHPYKGTINSELVQRRVELLLAARTNTDTFSIKATRESERFLECCLLICHAARAFIDLVSKDEKQSFLHHGVGKLEKISSRA